MTPMNQVTIRQYNYCGRKQAESGITTKHRETKTARAIFGGPNEPNGLRMRRPRSHVPCFYPESLFEGPGYSWT